MIRIPVVILAALLCCLLPAGVPAQGLVPGMASLSGWSCAPVHKANCSVDGRVGYLGYNRGLVFDVQATGTPIIIPRTTLPTFQQQIPVDGVWVGASLGGGRGSFSGCDPGSPLCLTLAASWLFPNNKEGSETAIAGQTTNTNLFFRSRSWSPKTQWYTLDIAASRCGWSIFSLIGGFRYDSFSTSFSNPSVVSLGTGGVSTPTDEAELVLTSYIPYLGGVATWGPVTVGFIGFPWVLGNVMYNETVGPFRGQSTGNYRSSYFFETFAEVGGQMGVIHLSGFATYTLLHAVGELNTSVNQFDGVLNPSGSYAWGFDRQNWIVGGKAVVGFNSPL